MNELCCELAYSGMLFWLPLIVCPDDKRARFCANQGLWTLILATVACWLLRIMGTVSGLLTGGALGIVAAGLYSLIYMLLLGFMLWLLINCVKAALTIHRGGEPEPIWFFERAAILR